MNISRLCFKNLINNPLNTLISLLLMTFGVGIISLLLLLNKQIEQQLQINLKGIDMVVGSKGSPMQIILSSIYHIDNPTGNIPYEEAVKIDKNPLVKLTVPLSFGDSYKGFRIVGTNKKYPDLYKASLKEGRFWEKNLEVVLGNNVALTQKLNIGDTFYGTHGLVEGGHVHDNYDYKVVGVFNPSNTVLDQLILCNTQSVWQVHNHEKAKKKISVPQANNDFNDNSTDQSMITSLLVKFKNPIGLIQLPRKINENTNLQAALPALEISRLTRLLGFGIQTINTIAIIIIIVSGLSIFISLYSSLKKRRYEIALIRIHGATKAQTIQLVLQESIILCLVGTILGLLISRLALIIIVLFFDETTGHTTFQLGLLNQEVLLIPTSLLVGLLASLIPVIISYNINIPKTLSND